MGVAGGMSEAYADELMDGVDLQGHGEDGTAYARGTFSVNLWAWIYVVGSILLLWLLGGLVFKGAVH